MKKNLNKNWATEVYKDTALSYEIEKKLYDKKSKFQHIEIYKTKERGNLMVLDGCFMLTEKEEFVYHEMIVHLPLFAHPNPRKILVIGGGDGGTVREVLKHKTVKQVDFVEIDEDVYKVSKKYFKTLTSGLENDERVNFLFGDGIKFVAETKNKYDVILIDSTDPSDISGGLFTDEFYRNSKKILNKNGIIVAQSEGPFYDAPVINRLHKRLKNIFSKVYLYLAYIPTYPSGCWSFTFVSDDLTPDIIRNKKSKIKGLKYYNNDIHKGALLLPEFVKEIIK
ncbi:MAG: polyamine aminopropyltransferase [Candidatus Goldbacteria bacterium]|nr:polyamine aminopropyltransferase [Candidatus Goldiibacteriota bacterium]